MAAKGNLWEYLCYCAVLPVYFGLRLLPHGALRILAMLAAWTAYAAFPLRRLVIANIRTAFPGRPARAVRRIARRSFYHLFYNLIEFFWIDGRPERIRRCYCAPDAVLSLLKERQEAGVRVIFVNPHLGSWEASGVMAPFYANLPMAAVAKPVHNPYLNDLLNGGSREKIPGLKIIFSRGAIRSAVKALEQGMAVGLLVDQNTRVRDGGVFVDFFGLPVAGSPAPALLKRFCDSRNIPTEIIYAASLRETDGRIVVRLFPLKRPFAEYASDREVLQEIMARSETLIAQYPEQYLWLYKRFQHIPPDCPEELKARYPYYAKVPDAKFFRKTGKPIN